MILLTGVSAMKSGKVCMLFLLLGLLTAAPHSVNAQMAGTVVLGAVQGTALAQVRIPQIKIHGAPMSRPIRTLPPTFQPSQRPSGYRPGNPLFQPIRPDLYRQPSSREILGDNYDRLLQEAISRCIAERLLQRDSTELPDATSGEETSGSESDRMAAERELQEKKRLARAKLDDTLRQMGQRGVFKFMLRRTLKVVNPVTQG